MPSVKDHEPHIALHGGEDGLDIHRKLASFSKTHLEPEGIVVVEMGEEQGDALKKIYEECGFTNVEVIKDLVGPDRILTAQGLIGS